MKKKIFFLFLLLLAVFAAVTWYQWQKYQDFIQEPMGLIVKFGG